MADKRVGIVIEGKAAIDPAFRQIKREFNLLRADFCEIVHFCGMVHRERAIIWPVGLVYWRGQMFRLEHKGNQYLTLSTSRGIDPHHKAHAVIQREWRSVRASFKPGWIWVRHGDAETSTLAKYRGTPAGNWQSVSFPMVTHSQPSSFTPNQASGWSHPTRCLWQSRTIHKRINKIVGRIMDLLQKK